MRITRHTWASWLLAGFACYSCFSWVHGAFWIQPYILDEVSVNERRYASLKNSLQGVPSAGFCVHSPELPIHVNFPIYQKYLLAQFALAPTVLHLGLESEWVIFDGEASEMCGMASLYEIICKESPGLALFRRRAQ